MQVKNDLNKFNRTQYLHYPIALSSYQFSGAFEYNCCLLSREIACISLDEHFLNINHAWLTMDLITELIVTCEATQDTHKHTSKEILKISLLQLSAMLRKKNGNATNRQWEEQKRSKSFSTKRISPEYRQFSQWFDLL